MMEPRSADWHADRRLTIGASDAPIITGDAPWGDVLTLFAVKTGLIDPPDISNNQTSWGLRLEAVVAEWFSETYGLILRRDNTRPRQQRIRFCTKPCWTKWEQERWAAKRGNCEECGAALTDRHAKRFCSPKCHGASIRKPWQLTLGLPRRTRPSRNCQGCGEAFLSHPSTLGQRYCSRDCYNRHEPTRQAQYDEAICAECGVPFVRRPANMRQPKGPHKFCSASCSKAYFRGERSPAWRGGSNPNRGTGWLKRAEEARARDGRCCRRCGKTEAENGEKLSVDHLIPWRTFASAEEANVLGNLVSLCRICHSIKTQVAERAWLKGDVQAMQRHIEAVTLPTAIHANPSDAKARGFLA